jgi:hypothetical protein
MDWRCGSNSREPALQAQSPEFKPPDPQKKKKKSRPGWATSQRQNENTKLPVLSILKRKKKK